MKNTTFCLSVLLIVAASTASFAQIGNPGLMYQGAFDNAMFLSTKAAIEKSVGKSRTSTSEKKTGETTTATAANLSFTSSPQIHKKVVQLIAAVPAKGDKAKQEAHATVLENAGLLGQFDKLLSAYGYNSHNLSDVFAGYMIIAWQVATGNDASQYTKGIAQFRKQMAEIMSANKAVTSLTSDQKQEMAETLGYISVIFTLGVQNQTKANDTATLNNTRRSMQALTMQATGIDILKYTFSNEGFTLK